MKKESDSVIVEIEAEEDTAASVSSPLDIKIETSPDYMNSFAEEDPREDPPVQSEDPHEDPPVQSDDPREDLTVSNENKNERSISSRANPFRTPQVLFQSTPVQTNESDYLKAIETGDHEYICCSLPIH